MLPMALHIRLRKVGLIASASELNKSQHKQVHWVHFVESSLFHSLSCILYSQLLRASQRRLYSHHQYLEHWLWVLVVLLTWFHVQKSTDVFYIRFFGKNSGKVRSLGIVVILKIIKSWSKKLVFLVDLLCKSHLLSIYSSILLTFWTSYSICSRSAKFKSTNFVSAFRSSYCYMSNASAFLSIALYESSWHYLISYLMSDLNSSSYCTISFWHSVSAVYTSFKSTLSCNCPMKFLFVSNNSDVGAFSAISRRRCSISLRTLYDSCYCSTFALLTNWLMNSAVSSTSRFLSSCKLLSSFLNSVISSKAWLALSSALDVSSPDWARL